MSGPRNGKGRPDRDNYDSWLAHHNTLVAWTVEQAGRRIVPGYEEGATRFCPECDACGSENGEPVRGLDSYGDCAEDGEHVVWTMAAAS